MSNFCSGRELLGEKHTADFLPTGTFQIGPYAWFYTDVRPHLWVVSTSGDTELCSALVGAVPGAPVYAGEMQGRQLGMDVHAWTDERQELVDAIGELVATKPFPSQPIFFWSDKDGKRYHESYFETFLGVWRHGDLFKLNARGGCFIYGRSDSTLTAERQPAIASARLRRMTISLARTSIRSMAAHGSSARRPTRRSIQSRYSSSERGCRVLIGFAATVPVCRLRCDHRTTLATLTPNVSAASRQKWPASTRRTTRLRKSSESARTIHADTPNSQHLESVSKPSRNPQPIQIDRITL